MNEKIDNLFSPDRLRRKWIPENKSVKKSLNRNRSVIPEGYQELYKFVHEKICNRYSENNRKFLEDLMAELKKQLNLRFSTTEGKVPSEEEKAVLNLNIEQILTQIEDLAEAFDRQDRIP